MAKVFKDPKWLAWVLQDVGNSGFATTIMAVMFPLFYREVLGTGSSKQLVLAMWGYGTALGMLVTALLAPALGAAADQRGIRKALFTAFTALGVASSFLMGLLPEGGWVLGLGLFIVGSLGFSFNNVFYDSFLPHIAPEEDRSLLSSAGYALGYLGGGVLLTINVFMAARYGEAGFRMAFASVALWWAAATVPFWLFIQEPPATPKDPLGPFARPIRTLRELPQNPNVMWFLFAFWLYNDGIGTIMRMGVIYGSSIGIDQRTLLMSLVATQFVGIPLTMLWAKVSDFIGDKGALMGALAVYLVICLFVPFIRTSSHFWAMALAIGSVQGGAQALSRSLFSRIVPKDRSAELFGFYDLSSKFAGVLGPMAFGLISQMTGSFALGGPLLAGFFLLGIVMLFKVRA
ncbi:MAG: MFS transporter [Thermanaerothrix sp.]|nr:MFS transporter [Thermanaerothrix sp.]